VPRRIFPAGTVTNTTGAPLRLTFHATSTSTRRETDLWTVDGSNYLSAQIPNGVILTDSSGAYSAFAGPDDIDTMYVGANGGSRSAITATGYVASSLVSSTYAQLIGQSTRNYKIVACALRNAGSGSSYWQPISDANHNPHNVGTVTTSTTKISIDYTSLGATAMGSFVVVPDETLAAAGIIAGASVTRTGADIYLSRPGRISDYVFYNGASWASFNSVFTPTYSAGVLTLTHPLLSAASGFTQDASVTPRGGTYLTNVGSTTDTTITVEFRDHSGTLVTTPDTNMKAFVTHGAQGFLNPQGVDTTALPNSNLWVLGIFQV
jgi:hypothetical protein